MDKTTKVKIDPITKTILYNAFTNVTDEMAEILEKTATSLILCELRDYSAAILDAKGRLITQAERGLPIHVASAELQLKAALDRFGNDFQPGDIILQNSPYTAAGNHLPDWTFIKPVFVGSELTFFVLCKGHQMDSKGAYPSGYFPGGYDIHSEGLLISPIKIFKENERQEVYDFILENVRWPEIVRIDNSAMMATLKRAEERIIALCEKYGKATALDIINIVMEDSEKAVRGEISQLPDGTYEGESLVDRDGSGNENVTVRVALTIKGDEMTIDFSKSDKQVSFVNAPIGTTYSCTYIGILPIFDPNILRNHGMLKPISIIAPKGSVVNCEYPATVACCGVFPCTQIINAIQMALGKVVPEKVEACWGPNFGIIFFGEYPQTNEPYWMTTFQHHGGGPAVEGADGCHGIAQVVCGGMAPKMPVELTEIKWPFRILKYGILPDSEGAGKFRGGMGIDYLAVNEGIRTIMTTGPASGENEVPFGLNGGKSGIPSKIFVLRHGKEEIRPTVSMFPIETGEIIGTRSSGGGGVGNPFERPIDKVKEDVINGVVSIERAREVYGVVINPKTFEVDAEATNKLRR